MYQHLVYQFFKTIEPMNKTALSIIAIIFVVTIGYWYWQDATPNETTEPSEETTSTAGGLSCHQNEEYFVAVRQRGQEVGEDILVKRKGEARDFHCAYEIASGDREFNQEAGHFFDLSEKYLFIDQGTAPPPRTIIVMDLETGEEVYRDLYNRPAAVVGDILTYWKPIDTVPTEDNCPELREWETGGLGAGLEEEVSLNLNGLTVAESGELRCSARQ